MISRRKQTMVAAAATVLATAPIVLIFDRATWLLQCIITVGMVGGAAFAVRSMRGRSLAQLAASTGALVVALTFFFADGTAIAGLIPGPATLRHFQDLFREAGAQIQTSQAPLPDLDPILFVTVLGIGAVAVLVDFLAVTIRRPALAGLPMLAIYVVPVAVFPDSVPAPVFAIGAAGFLWLLVSDNVERVRRFGRRYTDKGHGVAVWEPSPLAAAGRRLTLLVLSLAVVLPFLVPSSAPSFFSQYGFGDGSGSGRGGRGTVDLFAEVTGRLTQDEEQDLVRVSTNDYAPFYLRFAVADDVQPTGFRNRAPAGDQLRDELPAPVGATASDGERFTAQVEVLSGFDMPMIPVYQTAASVRGLDSSWLYDPEQQIVYSRNSRSAGARYEFDYVRSSYSPDELRSAQPLPTSHPYQREFTQVPAVAEVEQQVQELIDGKDTTYDQVRAIFDFFGRDNGFGYDLTTKPGTSGQAIVDFLRGKQGYCEQYASALTWMVRTAGIPARVAFGFTRGSNYSEGVYLLTNRNLHAWTEVFFDGYGWVPFDATPSVSIAGSARLSWAPDPDVREQPTGPTGPTLTPGTNGSADPGADLPPGLNPGDSGVTGGGIQPSATSVWVWWAAAGGTLALILLLTPAWRRLTLRRRRFRSASATAEPAAAAHAVWAELLDTMTDYGIAVDATETPRMTATRLAAAQRLPKAVAARTQLLGQAEEWARYARQPMAADGLALAVTDVREELAVRMSRRIRLAAMLAPPSVVQLWRSSIMSAIAAANDRLARTSHWLTRPLRLVLRWR